MRIKIAMKFASDGGFRRKDPPWFGIGFSLGRNMVCFYVVVQCNTLNAGKLSHEKCSKLLAMPYIAH